ncbi:hypothetical protein [Tenacibaculum jejuense]|uniref:Lipoprotein n=1 Tax=Tenacibaculum jejuense TaxID=584609 RepID=A0A238UE91_9FLAO|nr:hypothetical protein [Tenacibaculum jejuense]SNR16794.1 protein of unknown function [Tenacibaculum jejuense]
MQKIIKSLSYLVFFCLIISCNNDDELESLDRIESSKKNNEEVEYVYGPIIKIQDDFNENNFSNRLRTKISNDWKRLDNKDLKGLSGKKTIDFTNQHDLRGRFAWALKSGDKWPVSVSINNNKFESGKGSKNPNSQFKWYADYRVNGTLIKRTKSDYGKWKKVEGTNRRSARNKSGKRKFMELPGEWRVAIKNTSHWNVEGNIGVELGGEIKVPLVADASAKISVSLKHGFGGSKDKTITEVFKGGGIWVPAGKEVVWELSERHQTIKSEWKAPLEFKGLIGADYGAKKYEGHHFWAVEAGWFFHEYTRKDNEFFTINVTEESGKEIRVRSWVINDTTVEQ